MHELPITMSICRIASDEARRIGAKRILSITICQGEYTDYVPDIVQEYFNIVSEGTPAEGAKLELKSVPAILYCADCDRESRGEHFRMRCPLCNGRNVTLRSGKEFYIESMEIEEEEE